MRRPATAALVLLLAACSVRETDDQDTAQPGPNAAAPADDNLADSMASEDPAPGEPARADIPDPEERPIMQAQVVLDRQGFGPGVIDGRMGMSTTNALVGFQEANGLEETGELDEATEETLARWDNIPATRVVTVPEQWGRITYAKVPDDSAEQAEMDWLGYENLDEKLAERFHTTVAVLKELNPGGRPAGMDEARAPNAGATPMNRPTASQATPATATPTPTASPTTASRRAASASPEAPRSTFAAGQMIRVPNIGADRIAPDAISDRGWRQTLAALGVGTEQPEVVRIVVDESEKWLKGYDANDNLVALFTVTTGSSNDPLPLGKWGVNAVAQNPPFSYNPELFWDVPDSEEKRQLPPGPNGPVGVVWIDLTKEHYGIHGTNAPETIGRAQSHGCVRLTNWDAARLAGMVSGDTEVIFQA